MPLQLVLTVFCASMCAIGPGEPRHVPMPDLETCNKVADYRNAGQTGPLKWVCGYTTMQSPVEAATPK